MTIAITTLVMVAGGGWMLARSSLFALEGIDVAGAKTLSHAEVVRASGLKPGSNMLSLDLDAVEARVARLPLVETVEVTKPSPSRVQILIAERTPAFVLETIYGTYHLDAHAVVLGSLSAPDPSLPTIRSSSYGPVQAGDRIDSVDVDNSFALWQSLPGSLRTGSPMIEVDAGAVTMIRRDLTIRFGSFDRIEQKIEALRLVIERARAARERLITIDVRSPERPAAVAA